MTRSKPGVVQLPNPQKCREEASLWIARIDRGLSDRERLELDEWLAGHPRRAETLITLAALWDQADVLVELRGLFPAQRQPASRPRIARLAWAFAVAAVVVLALTAVMLVRPGAEQPPVQAQRQLYDTAIGEQSTVRLPDGSTVTLNTDSSIEVQYADFERIVLLLRGESYFQVAADSRRPFRVHAGGRTIEAIGTAFNVRLGSSNDIKMVVTEGTVSVLPDSAQPPAAATERGPDAIVDAGNIAIIERGPVTIQGLDAAAIDAELSWQQGMLVFDDEPLESVLREMSRYTTIELVPDDSIRDVRIGGYFRTGNVDELLIALREGLDIESRTDGTGRVLLVPATQSP